MHTTLNVSTNDEHAAMALKHTLPCLAAGFHINTIHGDLCITDEDAHAVMQLLTLRLTQRLEDHKIQQTTQNLQKSLNTVFDTQSTQNQHAGLCKNMSTLFNEHLTTTDVPVENTEQGWFDVNAYQHKDRWMGPDLADEIIDGFNTMEDAIECAASEDFNEFYQVTVVAYGEHTRYESGETVYTRYERND